MKCPLCSQEMRIYDEFRHVCKTLRCNLDGAVMEATAIAQLQRKPDLTSPGPWRVKPNEEIDGFFILNPIGKTVAWCYSGYAGKGEALANAELIASLKPEGSDE